MSESLRHDHWDVVVLGAGPAGALAAHQLAGRGLRVLLVEKRSFPRWKVCGACLNGQALAVLRDAGLASVVADQGGVPLHRFRVGLGGRHVEVPLPEGRALSRPRFDQALVEAAIAAGAVLRSPTVGRVGVLGGRGRLVTLCGPGLDTTVSAGVVLVAAGLGNRCLDRLAPISTHISPDSRVGAGCTLSEAPVSYRMGTIHMAVGRQGYVGLVRVEDGTLNLAAAFDRVSLRQAGGPAALARLVLAEAGFEPLPALEAGPWQCTPTLTRTTRPVAGERWLLLGDAAGYVEPFTGEGMGWALSAAASVVPFVLAGGERWSCAMERGWARMYGRRIQSRQRVCRALAALLRHPGAAGTFLEAARRFPPLARGVVHHLNQPPLAGLPGFSPCP